MTKMFIEVTPRLVHYDGTVKELGTVRYSIDEKVWPALRDGVSDYNAVQQLTPPVMLGNEAWSKIEFKVVFSDGDKPQGMHWEGDVVSNYPPELIEKIQKNSEYGKDAHIPEQENWTRGDG